jgi:PIN domain nuclease of toxin-antitoxin system
MFDEVGPLSRKALELIQDPENTLLLSAASIWELAIKQSLGRLEIKTPLEDLISSRPQNRNLQFLPINHEHALATVNLPFHHKDPFDRLLVAQCQVEKIPLLTPDKVLEKYAISIVW